MKLDYSIPSTVGKKRNRLKSNRDFRSIPAHGVPVVAQLAYWNKKRTASVVSPSKEEFS